jgi:hypothetical protein
LVVIGLAAGFVVAAWWGSDSLTPSPDSPTTEQRLDAIEAELAAEVRRRREIESELAALNVRVAPATDPPVVTNAPPDDFSARSSGARSGAEAAEETAPGEATPAVRRRPPFELGNDEIIARFVAAGIAPERAQWIVMRTEELRMEALRAQYDAAREGRPIDQTPGLFSPAGTLRLELGDTDYERYLQALDRPTSVYVRDVLATSPGARAGIKPGDQIVTFDGRRVFDMSEVNRLVLEGEPGQMVAVDVLRDGQLVQLYVPRGPIGITGGGRGGPAFRSQ